MSGMDGYKFFGNNINKKLILFISLFINHGTRVQILC